MPRPIVPILCGVLTAAATLLAASGCASSSPDRSATRSISQNPGIQQPQDSTGPEAGETSTALPSPDRAAVEALATEPDSQSTTPEATAAPKPSDPDPDPVRADAVPSWWDAARTGSSGELADSRGTNRLAVSGEGDTLARSRDAAIERARALASDRHGVGPAGVRILRAAARPAPDGGFTTYLLVGLDRSRTVNAEAPPEQPR